MRDWLIGQYGWQIHHRELYELLGITNNRLPLEGVEPVTIGNIKVWVTASGPHQRGFHRTLCQCPICGQTMSVGRLMQHRRVHPESYKISPLPGDSAAFDRGAKQ